MLLYLHCKISRAASKPEHTVGINAPHVSHSYLPIILYYIILYYIILYYIILYYICKATDMGYISLETWNCIYALWFSKCIFTDNITCIDCKQFKALVSSREAVCLISSNQRPIAGCVTVALITAIVNRQITSAIFPSWRGDITVHTHRTRQRQNMNLSNNDVTL